MFTIDFFAAPETLPLDSRTIDCTTIQEAVAEAELILAHPDSAHLHTGDRPVAGYVVTDELNVIVHSTFDPVV